MGLGISVMTNGLRGGTFLRQHRLSPASLIVKGNFAPIQKPAL